jgi:cytoskeletal protein RodZ
MKRRWTFTALLVTILLTFSLVGCGSATKNVAQSKKESKATTEVTAAQKQVEKQTAEKKENNQAQESVNTPTNEKSSETPVSSSTAVTNAAKTTTTVQSNSNTKTSQTVKTSVKSATSTATSTTSTNANTGTTNKSQVPAAAVTLSITGPKDHPSILEPTKVTYKTADTVFTVLSREAALKNFFIDKKGSGATLYIQGLEDNGGKWSFYEFDYGPKSGWIFKINGAELTKSAGISNVKAGDRIECIYIQ